MPTALAHTAGSARDLGGYAVTEVAIVDSLGNQISAFATKPSLSLATSNGTAVGTATNTVVVAAPSTGFHLRVYRIHASNANTTAVKIGWRDGVGGNLNFEMALPQYGVASLELEGEWNLTTATALYLNTDAAGSVYWTVTYQTVAD